MAINAEQYHNIKLQLAEKNVNLVAVSKTRTVEDIKALYDLGVKDFGENYVQELTDKQAVLPKDIRWHFIGHLQTNKVKLIAPFIYLIHSVDSYKLLQEINKQADKNNRIIDCLLQIYIADEETKFGMNEEELDFLMRQYNDSEMKNIKVIGLMGMASFTENVEKIRAEFKYLKSLFHKLQTQNSKLKIVSMGMSNDYAIAIEEGSTMVRIGSLFFSE